MEIDITSLLETDQFALSHSRAEGGQDAGPNTWRASLDAATETPLLDTPEKLQAMRDFARESGGWNAEEIAAWTDQEVNALFLQWVAGDCRQCVNTDAGDLSWDGADTLADIDWEKTEALQQDGCIPSNLFRADDGRIYFYLGN